MKIRITFLSMLAVSIAFVASAQVVEYDDMYFNSKDRAVVLASKPLMLKNISAASYEVKTAINPTDSYSARNVNPEYISQSTVNPSGASEPVPYFTPDYTPVAVNQYLNSNSSTNWNNNIYPYGGIGTSFGMMSAFGSPFGGYYPSMYRYDPMMMAGYYPYSYGGFGGYNGFYNPGWSSMMSIGFGMGNYYPWGISPYYNNFYGTNYFNGWGGSYYPGNVIVLKGDAQFNSVTYGKRTSRSNDLNNPVSLNNRNTTTNLVTTDTQGRVRGANGRVSGDATTNTNTYYQRGWRENPETNSATGTSWGNSSVRSGNDSGISNRSNSGYTNSRSNSSFFDSGSRGSNAAGSSSFSSGGGSRSGGSTGSSSGSSRGRD